LGWSFLIKNLNFTLSSLKNTIMGRGDKRTAKGKRFKGSFGKSRPATAGSATAKKKAAKKKA
jgi:30S ribosomal protein S31